jgi:hypothetical protein
MFDERGVEVHVRRSVNMAIKINDKNHVKITW